MSRSPLAIAARVIGVAGIVGATVLQGVVAHAAENISFINCSSPAPSATPSPTPTGGSGPTPTPTASASPTPSPAPTPTQTPDNCVPNSGTVITDVRTLRFSVHTDTFQTHIDSVTASIHGSSQGVPQPDQTAIHVQCPGGDCHSNNSNRKDETDQVVWDTNDLTRYNGVYTFKVAAHFTSPTRSVTKTADDQCVRGCNLVVDNPPQQPNPPRIVVTTSSSVSIAWDKNPEPDVLSYTVYRALTKDKNTPPTDAMFKLDFTTVGTSVRESVGNAGAYWYRVQATRRSFSPAHKDTGISSPLSSTSAAGIVKATSTGKKSTKTGGSVYAPAPPAAAVLTPPGLIPTVAAAPPPVPDAPYSAFLPYKSSGSSEDAGPPAPESGARGGGVDPRGAILPVAVGAFLVSSALALGRMPF